MNLSVTLRVITDENRDSILNLKVGNKQRAYIATNERTLYQAAEAPEAWLRAIYAGDTLVGLVLLHDEHLRTPPREIGYYFLWRLMIDERYQGRGYAQRAVDLVIDYVSKRPHAKRLLCAYLPGKDGPEKFYQRYGFAPTGNMIDEDIEIEIALDRHRER